MRGAIIKVRAELKGPIRGEELSERRAVAISLIDCRERSTAPVNLNMLMSRRRSRRSGTGK